MTPAPPSARPVAVCIDTRDGAGRNRLHGVAQCLRSLGWRMMLVRESGRTAAREVIRLSPGGILAYVADRWLVAAASKLGVPLVDTALGEEGVPMTVSLDNHAVGRLAAAHFREAGLQHFGYCGVEGRLASEQRRKSLERWLGGAPVASFSEPVPEGEARLDALTHWLLQLPKPAGLLVFDDKLGERVLTACHWANLSVPHQVAVLGIGNDDLMCEVAWPGLSSISLPTSRIGYEAATMLVRTMTGQVIPESHVQIQPLGIVARGSTDLVATDDALVRSAVQFIRAHAGELIGVKQVAEALRVSRRTLDRHFLGALGRPARQELARVRMQRAAALLTAAKNLDLATVARNCGYSTRASFSRAFHQHTGRWPSVYREELAIR